MSKTAHYVTLYKYQINDVIKYTWGIPYKRVDAAAVVAAHLSVRRACVSTADMTRRWRPMLTSCAGNTKPVHRSSKKLKNYENWSKDDEITTRNAIAYFFGPPCILETIIAFILVLITCVYVLGLTVSNSGRAPCI